MRDTSEATRGSDPVYKRFYAFPEMVEDLLRSLFPPETLDTVDWPSLGRLSTEYVGEDFRRGHGDTVWRAGLKPGDERGDCLYVLVLLEYQATTDATMALRVLEYTAMLYRELLREGAKPGRLPPVLPVVLYNGDSRWRAATDVRELALDAGPALAPYQPSQRHMVLDERHASADDVRLRKLTRAVLLLEQSRTPAQLARTARLVREWLGSAGREELKRAFADWLWVLGRRLARGGGEPPAPPPNLTLEEATIGRARGQLAGAVDPPRRGAGRPPGHGAGRPRRSRSRTRAFAAPGQSTVRRGDGGTPCSPCWRGRTTRSGSKRSARRSCVAKPATNCFAEQRRTLGTEIP